MCVSATLAVGALAGAASSLMKPDEPDAPKVPKADPEELKARAKRRSAAAKARATGFGLQSTFQTGAAGLPPVAGKGGKSLLGQ